MSYRTRPTKAQKKAQSFFFAIDHERWAREQLDKACDKNLSKEAQAEAFDKYQDHVRWRDQEMIEAVGMNWADYHDFAFAKWREAA